MRRAALPTILRLRRSRSSLECIAAVGTHTYPIQRAAVALRPFDVQATDPVTLPAEDPSADLQAPSSSRACGVDGHVHNSTSRLDSLCTVAKCQPRKSVKRDHGTERREEPQADRVPLG